MICFVPLVDLKVSVSTHLKLPRTSSSATLKVAVVRRCCTCSLSRNANAKCQSYQRTSDLWNYLSFIPTVGASAALQGIRVRLQEKTLGPLYSFSLSTSTATSTNLFSVQVSDLCSSLVQDSDKESEKKLKLDCLWNSVLTQAPKSFFCLKNIFPSEFEGTYFMLQKFVG